MTRSPDAQPSMLTARLLTLFLALAGTAAAQDERGADAIDKYRAYLEHDPFHDAVFDRLVHDAIEGGTLSLIEREYVARLESDSADEVARVVLARLHARGGRPREALGMLAELTAESAALLHLRGKLHLSLGELEPAAAALDRAAEVSQDRLLAIEVLTLAGRSHVRAGDSEAAVRAFRALAELEPASLGLRLEAAALLEENALDDAALAELRQALELARGQSEDEVRVHVAIGRLQERRGSSEEALAAYARASQLMGPGHWRRVELFERRLAIHRGRGDLELLLDACRADTEALPADRDARLFLARALVVAERPDEAIEVLARAAADFPESLTIGRRRAELLAAAGRAEEAVVEYQRLSARHPGRLEVLREAGTLLAALGRVNAARARWERALELEPENVELHLELARLHARFGMRVRAEQLMRAAIELAPHDLRPVRALAAQWGEGGSSSRSAPLYERTQELAARRGDAYTLEEIAVEWVERDEPTRALRAFEAALDAGGDPRRILPQLVALLDEGRQFERSAAAQSELFRLATTAGERADGAERIGKLYARNQRPRRLEREQRRVLAESPGDLHASLLLARSLGLSGDYAGAVELLSELGEEHRQDALRHLSWVDEVRNDFVGAIAHQRELLALRPRDARHVLEDIARLYRRAGDEAGAAQTYEELLASNPTSRVLLTDLAREHSRRKEPQRAAELLRRLLALHPGDDEARLTLADIEVRLAQVEAARENLALALRSREPVVRARARELYRGRFSKLVEQELEIELLRARLAAEPARFELGVLLALRAHHLFDYRGAHSVTEELLGRFPREPALLEMREELRGLTLEGLRAEYPPATSGIALPPDFELASLLLAQGERARARAVLDALGSPVRAANLCLARGAPGDAELLLQSACRESRDPHLWMRLAIAHLASGRENRAARAVDEAVAIGDDPWNLLIFQGELRHLRRYRQGAREVGRRLFGRLAESRKLAGKYVLGRQVHERRVNQLVDFYVDNGIERELLALGEESLLREPRDPPLLDAVLTRMDSRYHGAQARGLLEAARSSKPPRGWDAETWRELVELHAVRFAIRRRVGGVGAR